MQKRAKVGGETGVNGEWYEGGKFIATTEQPKGTPATTQKPAGKQQYEPYKWAAAPEPGQRALFTVLDAFAKRVWPGLQMERHEHPAPTMWGYDTDELIAMWNNGVRWVTPKQF
jgi:hypothetical protein